MTKPTVLATALASVVLFSACTLQAPPLSKTRPSIRLEPLQGAESDIRVCDDGRLLVFPKGHDIPC
jgi:hypothetical protein